MKASEIETMKQEIESIMIAFKKDHKILSLAQFFKYYHDFKEIYYNYVRGDEWFEDDFETHTVMGKIELKIENIKNEIEADCNGNHRLESAFKLLEYEY